MAADPEVKSYHGLLKGIARRQYYNDAEISDGILKEQLYPNLTDEDFETLAKKTLNMIKVMASTDMDFNQLEAFLTSLTKKKDGAISEGQAKVIDKFWRANRSKIHASLIAQTTWCNTLKSVNWRVDLSSYSAQQTNHVPTAVVELQLNNGSSKVTDTVRFEMDESKMSSMLKSLGEIEEQVGKFCNS